MSLETGTYVSDLVITNPDGSDSRTTSDDHHRLQKKVIKNTLCGFTGGVVVTGTDGGAVNAYTVTPTTNALPSYTDRVSVVFAPTVTNTGAATINISGLGAKNIKRIDGSDVASGDLVSGSVYVAIYNGTEFRLLAPTKNYIDQLSLGSAYPASPGDAGKFLKYTGSAYAWSYAGISSVVTTSGSSNITLTSTSAGYQSVAMTAMGKHVALPDATTMTVGGPVFILKNDGGYQFGIRDNAGTLVMAVAAGGIAYVTLKDNSTAAGSWSVIGDNLEPGLITIDSTFSSTYASTVLAPFVALDSNTSIHFAALSSGFAAFVADNTGKVVSTPVTVDSTASSVPKHCFKIDATHAMVFYGSTSNTLFGVVLTLTGSSPSFSLTVNTAANSGANTGIAVEDFIGAPKIGQLDTNLFLVSWATATGAGNTSVMGVQVSGSTTVNFGSKADIITSNNVINSTQTRNLTTTTGAVLYKEGAATPYANKGVVISVTNANPPVCTVNTPAAATNCQSSQTSPCSSALLSPTKLAIADDNNATQVTASGFTFSGTTTTAWTAINVETGLATNLIEFTTNSATRYNPHLWLLSAGGTNTFGCWYLDSSGVSRAVVLSESGGTVTAGAIMYRSISFGTSNGNGHGSVLPQGTSEFLTVQVGGNIASANKYRAIANKIVGTNITVGTSVGLEEMSLTADILTFGRARLSSGDYLITISASSAPNYSIPVLRSNGDYVVKRGAITVPPLHVNGTTPPIVGVGNNRVVLLISTEKQGTTAGISTYQLRLLNVEIAA